jgi:hypothetical protein
MGGMFKGKKNSRPRVSKGGWKKVTFRKAA